MPIDRRELILALSDPAVRLALREFVVGVSHDVTTGQVPGFGAGQNDTFDDRDNVDPTHPMNLRWFVPGNSQRIVRGVLTWFLHPYRTYSSLTLSSTGGQSVNHTHPTGGETGHFHNHGHTTNVSNSNFVAVVKLAGAVFGNDSGLTANVATSNDATGSSGHDHGSTSPANVDHQHSISGTSILAIAEGATASGITIKFDGVDQTAALGGPWNADVIELDVTKQIAPGPSQPTPRVPHLIQLASATLGQIEVKLRLSFYANAAQGG